MPEEARYLIQIEQPEARADLTSIRRLLEQSGVRIDLSYGPYDVDPKRGRYVMRGWATPEGRKKAETIPGVRFFADARVQPI